MISAGVDVIQTPAEVTMNDGVVKNVNEHMEMTDGKILVLMARDEFIVMGDKMLT